MLQQGSGRGRTSMDAARISRERISQRMYHMQQLTRSCSPEHAYRQLVHTWQPNPKAEDGGRMAGAGEYGCRQVGALLFDRFRGAYLGSPQWSVPFDLADPIETPRDIPPYAARSSLRSWLRFPIPQREY